MAYLGQKINREYLDRTNKRPSLSNEGDADDMTFMIDGRKYTFYTSPYVDGGTVYGFRRGGGNWKRYTPPDVRGTTRMSEAKADIPSGSSLARSPAPTPTSCPSTTCRATG